VRAGEVASMGAVVGWSVAPGELVMVCQGPTKSVWMRWVRGFRGLVLRMIGGVVSSEPLRGLSLV
jgi:hypothetical protein